LPTGRSPRRFPAHGEPGKRRKPRSPSAEGTLRTRQHPLVPRRTRSAGSGTSAADQRFLLRDDEVGNVVLPQDPGEDLHRRLELLGDDRVRPRAIRSSTSATYRVRTRMTSRGLALRATATARRVAIGRRSPAPASGHGPPRRGRGSPGCSRPRRRSPPGLPTLPHQRVVQVDDDVGTCVERSTRARFFPFIPYPEMITWFSTRSAPGASSPGSSGSVARTTCRTKYLAAHGPPASGTASTPS